jgi:hypothetical protein
MHYDSEGGPPVADDKSKSRKATAVPDGHRRIRWAYCAADTSKNGTVEDVPADEAAIWTAEHRAVYVDDDTPLGPVEREMRPTRAPLGGASADTSSAGEPGSTTAASTGTTGSATGATSRT